MGYDLQSKWGRGKKVEGLRKRRGGVGYEAAR